MIGRRRFVLSCAAFLAAGSVFGADREEPGKKGWSGGDQRMHDLFGVKWYYNWQPTRQRDDIEFVPMMKSEKDANDLAFDKIRSYEGIHSLLGFNEGERINQGNISVERAIDVQPSDFCHLPDHAMNGYGYFPSSSARFTFCHHDTSELLAGIAESLD